MVEGGIEDVGSVSSQQQCSGTLRRLTVYDHKSPYGDKPKRHVLGDHAERHVRVSLALRVSRGPEHRTLCTKRHGLPGVIFRNGCA